MIASYGAALIRPTGYCLFENGQPRLAETMLEHSDDYSKSGLLLKPIKSGGVSFLIQFIQ